MKIKGITVTLYEKIQTGRDELNHPVYEEIPTQVDNVLIGEPTTADITSELNLNGKRLAYTLAIPKGDAHDWMNQRVEFFGETFKTYGYPTQGIEENIPLLWNKKVKVERYGA